MRAFFKKIFNTIKNRAILIVICVAIVGLCWTALFFHYTRGGRDDFITKLETNLLDLRFRNRGVVPPKSKVGVLAIDEKSIIQFGRWPFSRRYYTQAMANLKKHGVQWIGFDAVFSEAEHPSVQDVAANLKNIKGLQGPALESAIGSTLKDIDAMGEFSPGDRTFAEGIKDFGNAILGFFYFRSRSEVEAGNRGEIPFQGLDTMGASAIDAVILPDGQELTSYGADLKVHGIVTNIPQINNASKHFAFFSNEADSDAIMRWVTVVKVVDKTLMPSLALKSAAESMNRDILVAFDSGGVESIELISREDQSDVVKIPVDPLGAGRVLINHRGPALTFPHYSLADAYNDTFTPEQLKNLKGAVLLVGMTAIGINDQRPNPFDPTFDGVEVHATVTDNIISHDLMQRPKTIYSLELLIILLIGLFFSPILIFTRAIYSALLMSIFLTSYYYFDQFYWFSKGTWAYLGMPFIEMISLFVTITLYKYVSEEREKRKVKGAFSLYLSPDVINQVLDNPGALSLGGVRKELTVFFSDVRGFTTISESLTPEKLCEFMNDYFTPMTSIILRSKGVLDKYIGDAIMAFWGAPIPMENQADVAADAAIDMLFALDRVQEDFIKKGFPKCDIGIGLNTGPMSVGNMGSGERFCYTVMGDSVNLGARLEGLTKEYGAKILAAEATVSRFKNKNHFARDLDDIRVKGKNEPIKVFQILRPDMLPQESQIRDLISAFEEGRKHFRAQEWDKATHRFNQCIEMYANDGAAKLYLERITEYAAQPRMENWDGVYTFTHK